MDVQAWYGNKPLFIDSEIKYKHVIQGENIAKYSYENAGLYIYEHGQDGRRLVDPVGAELKKWESDFLKPIGRELKLRFKNTGKIH